MNERSEDHNNREGRYSGHGQVCEGKTEVIFEKAKFTSQGDRQLARGQGVAKNMRQTVHRQLRAREQIVVWCQCFKHLCCRRNSRKHELILLKREMDNATKSNLLADQSISCVKNITQKPTMNIKFKNKKIILLYSVQYAVLPLLTLIPLTKIPSEMEVASPHKRFTQFSALIKLQKVL